MCTSCFARPWNASNPIYTNLIKNFPNLSKSSALSVHPQEYLSTNEVKKPLSAGNSLINLVTNFSEAPPR